MVAHVDESKLSMYVGSYRLNPAPLMAYSQAPLTNDVGDRFADQVTLSFAGTLLNLANLGSGDASNMITLRDNLIAALSGQGNEFRLLHHLGSTSPSGTPIISGVYPRVEGLTFDQGIWVDRIDYSFDLIYETNYVSGSVPISAYGDNWEFQENSDNRVIGISHSVNAKGINTAISGGASTAMENARVWVNARMGVGTIPSNLPSFADSGTLGSFAVQKYRTESASETAGTYEAREEITMASGHYANNWTAQFQQNEEGITTLTLNGSIEGLGRFDAAIDHAVSGWNNHVQPQLSGLASAIYTELGGTRDLNVDKVQSLSVTRDTYNGRVGYSTSYNDDPSDDLPSGISEFNICLLYTSPSPRD